MINMVMMKEDKGRVRVLFIWALDLEMVLCIPCGPICSSQPLSFCLVAMFEVNIIGSITFWDEMGAS